MMLLTLEHLDEKNSYAVVKRCVMVVMPSAQPICITLGRKVESDLSFPLDKSVSRTHCQITIYPNGSLTITDLKSSFGTHVNGIKSAPHEEAPLNNKSRIKCGNEFTNIRISKFRFCNTRLEKAEKNRLKEICRAVGGDMVKQLDDASHLLCNRYSATVKILQAFVIQRPIVCFAFAESLFELMSLPEVMQAASQNKKVMYVTHPDETEFKPMESLSISHITDPLEPRVNLWSGHTIILLESGDDQYLSIFAQCGALVVDLTSFPANATVPELSAEVQRQRDVKGSSELSTCSIFFEESKSPSAKTILYSREANLQFVNAGALVMSIFENSPPKLLPPDTLSLRAMSQHQSQMQYSQVYVDSTTTSTNTKTTTSAQAKKMEDVKLSQVPSVVRNAPLDVVKEEKLSGELSGETDSKSGRMSDCGGAGGLPRATTLLPTQELDEKPTGVSAAGALVAAASAVAKNTTESYKDMNSAGASVKKSPSPPQKLSKSKSKITGKNFPVVEKVPDLVPSPVQMCDINIEVDFSEEEVTPLVEANLQRDQKIASPPKNKVVDIATKAKQSVITSPAKVKKSTGPTPEISKKRIASARDDGQTAEEEGEEDSGEMFSAPPPRSRRKKNVSSAQVGSLDEDLVSGGIVMGEVDGSAEEEVYDDDGGGDVDNNDDNGDGWCSSRGRKRKQIKKAAQPTKKVNVLALPHRVKLEDHHVAEISDAPIEYPQPVSIEVHLQLRTPPTTGREVASTNRHLVQGDKRCFLKNFVRGHFQNSDGSGRGGSSAHHGPQVVISFRQMEKLLPKESEREIQLQRAYEDEQLKLVQREELFSERVEKGKGKRKLFG